MLRLLEDRVIEADVLLWLDPSHNGRAFAFHNFLDRHYNLHHRATIENIVAANDLEFDFDNDKVIRVNMSSHDLGSRDMMNQNIKLIDDSGRIWCGTLYSPFIPLKLIEGHKEEGIIELNYPITLVAGEPFTSEETETQHLKGFNPTDDTCSVIIKMQVTLGQMASVYDVGKFEDVLRSQTEKEVEG